MSGAPRRSSLHPTMILPCAVPRAVPFDTGQRPRCVSVQGRRCAGSRTVCPRNEGAVPNGYSPTCPGRPAGPDPVIVRLLLPPHVLLPSALLLAVRGVELLRLSARGRPRVRSPDTVARADSGPEVGPANRRLRRAGPASAARLAAPTQSKENHRVHEGPAALARGRRAAAHRSRAGGGGAHSLPLRP